MYECPKGSCIFLNTKCNMQRNKNVLNWTSVNVALPAPSCCGGTEAVGAARVPATAQQWVLIFKWEQSSSFPTLGCLHCVFLPRCWQTTSGGGAAALAGGTAIAPVGLPSVAAPDEGFGRAGLGCSLPTRCVQPQLAPSRAAEAASPRGKGLTACIER